MLAQLFTYYEVSSDQTLLDAFYELEKRQSWVYQLWRKFRESPKENVYWGARNKPDQIRKLLKGLGINCPSKVRSRIKIGPTAAGIPVAKPGGYYIVNTCSQSGSMAYPDMLKDEKASAYGKSKSCITKITKGDTVFLYHNQVGIIAFGKAVDNYKENVENDEYYVPVKFEWKIDPSKEPQKAVKASEINHKLNLKYPFRQAV
jgi:hypothetical protein